jgi:hypothetical protein
MLSLRSWASTNKTPLRWTLHLRTVLHRPQRVRRDDDAVSRRASGHSLPDALGPPSPVPSSGNHRESRPGGLSVTVA